MVKGRSISVNAQRACGAALALLLAWAASGCNTFSHYPLGMERTTLEPLREGRDTGYERTFRRRVKRGREQVLFAMEKGRVAQLEGDYAISRAAFEGAIESMRAQDDRAVISATGAAGQVGAVLVNDKAIPYRALGYERTLVHHFQTLNYLAARDLTGAGVEVRRANLVQEEARRRREREVERVRSPRQNQALDEDRDPHLAGVYAGLDELAGNVKYSFQNAATFYLSGVVWEMLGEPNDAYIDYKKALEIYPDNAFLQQDVIRLGRRLGMREDVEDFVRRFPAAADTPAHGTGELAGKARLVVLYEDGLVPRKSEMSVAYPLTSAGSIGVISLPTYAERTPLPVPLAVKVGGRGLGQTEPICNVSALAARALQEQMPGIVTRQVSRAIAKGTATKAARDSAGDIGALAMTLYNVFSEQADLRSWLTLPAYIHAWSGWIEPGERTVALSRPGGGSLLSEKVTLTAGRTTLLIVTRIDLAVYSRIMMQP